MVYDTEWGGGKQRTLRHNRPDLPCGPADPASGPLTVTRDDIDMVHSGHHCSRASSMDSSSDSPGLCGTFVHSS